MEASRLNPSQLTQRLRDSKTRYEVTRLFERPSPWRVVARRWWWVFIRRHETEICGACGGPVNRATPSWWTADDALWMDVVGDEAGIRCVPCFTEEARAKGIWVFWKAAVDA